MYIWCSNSSVSRNMTSLYISRGYELELHRSSFLVASSWHAREDVTRMLRAKLLPWNLSYTQLTRTCVHLLVWVMFCLRVSAAADRLLPFPSLVIRSFSTTSATISVSSRRRRRRHERDSVGRRPRRRDAADDDDCRQSLVGRRLSVWPDRRLAVYWRRED